MYIADMHCDTLTTLSDTRGLINEYNMSNKHGQLQFFAAFVPFKGRSAKEREAEASRLMNAYLYETERLGIMRINSVRDLTHAEDTGRTASVFSIEGGAGLLADSEQLFTLYKLGLRVMGLAWDSNELASACGSEDDTGLTFEGVRMLNRMADVGIIPDVSHLSDQSIFDLFDVYPLPVLATHSNFRAKCNHKRNLTDGMAKEIANRGGVIGLNLYPDFLASGGDASVKDFITHLEYGLELVGEEHVGLGLDIDGMGGKLPRGLTADTSVHDTLYDLLSPLYSESLLEKIMGGNVVSFLKSTLD